MRGLTEIGTGDCNENKLCLMDFEGISLPGLDMENTSARLARVGKSGNPILDLTFSFSLSIISYCSLLERERKYTVSNQLLRSATSIGANVREAQNAESRADFIHKMKVAAKEAEETDYWLQLCQCSEALPSPTGLSDDLLTIKKILAKIIGTTKSRYPNR
jgi:four helix bundle protein